MKNKNVVLEFKNNIVNNISKEWADYISMLSEKSKDEIISMAYESAFIKSISWQLNQYIYSDILNEEQLEMLSKQKNLLHEIYDDWLSYDDTVSNEIDNSISCSIEKMVESNKNKSLLEKENPNAFKEEDLER